jgi:hypothetical protein
VFGSRRGGELPDNVPNTYFFEKLSQTALFDPQMGVLRVKMGLFLVILSKIIKCYLGPTPFSKQHAQCL